MGCCQASHADLTLKEEIKLHLEKTQKTEIEFISPKSVRKSESYQTIFFENPFQSPDHEFLTNKIKKTYISTKHLLNESDSSCESSGTEISTEKV